MIFVITRFVTSYKARLSSRVLFLTVLSVTPCQAMPKTYPSQSNRCLDTLRPPAIVTSNFSRFLADQVTHLSDSNYEIPMGVLQREADEQALRLAELDDSDDEPGAEIYLNMRNI